MKLNLSVIVKRCLGKTDVKINKWGFLKVISKKTDIYIYLLLNILIYIFLLGFIHWSVF